MCIEEKVQLISFDYKNKKKTANKRQNTLTINTTPLEALLFKVF